MAKKTVIKKSIITGLIISLIACIFCLVIDNLALLKRIELKSLDLRFKLRPQIKMQQDLGFLDYDDPSIDLFGLWPWNRNRQVALVDTLKFYNSKAAGYDVFFTEKSNIVFTPDYLTTLIESPARYYSQFMIESTPNSNLAKYNSVFSQAEQKNLMLKTLDLSYKNYDLDLEQSFAKAKNIFLAQFMEMPSEDVLLPPKKGIAEKTKYHLKKILSKIPLLNKFVKSDNDESLIFDEIQKTVKKRRMNYTDEKKLALEELEKTINTDTSVQFKDIYKKHLFKTVDIGAPLYRFIKASAGIGFAQIVEDMDYTVRLFPAFLYFDRHIHPALTLKMASYLLDFNMNDIIVKPSEYILIKNALEYGTNKRSDFKIPIDDKCQLLMNWAGEFDNTYFHYSFKTIALYYAYIKCKQIVSYYPDNPEFLDLAFNKLKNYLVNEQLVESKLIEKIAGTIAIAKCYESEIVRSKISDIETLKNNLKIESLKPYFDEAFYSTKIGNEIAKQFELNQNLNYKDFIKSIDYNFDQEYIKEIFDNIEWFAKKNRLNDIKPFCFPEKQTIKVFGKPIKVSPTYLENKIFMIGLTGIGTIDLNPMPFEQSCPMVALHTNAINMFLTRQALSFPPEWYKYVSTIFLVVLIGLLSVFLSATKGLIVSIFISLIYTLAVWLYWTKSGVWLNFVTPLLSIYISYLITAIYKFIQSTAERKKIRNIFSTMVSPAVLKVMEDNPDLLSLTGERKAATTAFSMVFGFNKVTSSVAPDYLSKILSVYLTPTSEIIMDYDGYIDKYEGHIIMADYGVPLDDPGNAWKCAYSSVEQQLDIAAFRYYVYVNYGVKVTTMLGYNFGYVSAGNMGSEKKMQYTVMGDAVNVGARFMPANLIYNTRVITGGSTYYKIKDFAELRKLDRLLLKGKTTPTEIYETLGWNKDKYIELLGHKPVPESLRTRWKFAPGGKVFGYFNFWKQAEKDFTHPMISKISKFFENQLISNATRIENANKIFFLELIDEINKVIKSYGIDNPIIRKDSHDTLLEDWLNKIVLPVLDKLRTDSEKMQEFHNIQLLENKILMFKKKLELKDNVDDLILFSFDHIKEFIINNKNNETIETINANESQLELQYQTAVESLISEISVNPMDYRLMMAEIGSITDSLRKVRDLYEDSIQKYWNRQWDDAISGFSKCVEIIPDDPASLCLLERVKYMKDNPPADNWQGEFIQTKK
ncbi:CHASE2 domain-containing protein [Candidatus Dependentiae bacterium]|nr:CHASE2 domain-containing protein [Candidatus Dependentiae bacterium]